ncbi:hypothetical protein DRQ33_08000, partial [bacterium]
MNLVIALTISAILLWAITLMNGYFWFSTDIRMSLFLFWLGVSIIAVLYAVIPPLARPPSLRKIAIQFEREYPTLQEHLIAAYDLANENPN